MNEKHSLVLPAAFAAIALLSFPAMAVDVYRCTSSSGKIEFRDRPCDGGSGTKIDIKPNVAGMSADDLRAKTAEMKARQVARQDAENRANADAEVQRQQAIRDERGRIDQAALEQAAREGAFNAQSNNFYGRPTRPLKVDINVLPPAPPSPAIVTPRR